MTPYLRHFTLYDEFRFDNRKKYRKCCDQSLNVIFKFNLFDSCVQCVVLDDFIVYIYSIKKEVHVVLLNETHLSNMELAVDEGLNGQHYEYKTTGFHCCFIHI